MIGLDNERIAGIETYLTKFKGIGGKLRTIPEDFIVEEISKYPTENEKGMHTIASVTSLNWETNQLIKELSKKLHISRNRINFAGTKDKRAKKTQLMSLFNVSKEELSNIKINYVNIQYKYQSHNSINIGDLIGNRFSINIRNIRNSVIKKDIEKITNILKDNCGFPNFFGIQRFGIIRTNTHIVGKYIVNNDFKNAVLNYIANPIKGENEEIYSLREKLQKTYDFKKALITFPNNLNFEKAILNSLVTKPDDYVSALKELPKNLLTMFVYAYQSFIFNKILSVRMKNGLPLNEAIIGDVILPFRMGQIEKLGIYVKENNINKINKQISKNKAYLSTILIGSDTKFSKGQMGEIEQKIIEKEKINPLDFIIPEIPYMSSYGSRRPLIATFSKLKFNIEKDILNKNMKMLKLKFELNKSSYATSFLREIMKSEDIVNY